MLARLTCAGSGGVPGVPDVGGDADTQRVVGASTLTVGGAGQAGRVAMEMLVCAFRAC